MQENPISNVQQILRQADLVQDQVFISGKAKRKQQKKSFGRVLQLKLMGQ